MFFSQTCHLLTIILVSVLVHVSWQLEPDAVCAKIGNVKCDDNPGCSDCSPNGLRCKQCNADKKYFLPSRKWNEDKCLSVEDIPGCLFVADEKGCQQCIDPKIRPKPNSCGINICPANASEPTASPTSSPTLIPTSIPTMIPTRMPITLEQRVGFFFTQDTGFVVDPSYVACIGDFGCGGADFLQTFAGICDLGANTIIEFSESLESPDTETLFQIFQYTTCCESSLEGTFFIKNLQYNQNHLVTGIPLKTVVIFLDATDLESFTAIRDSKLSSN